MFTRRYSGALRELVFKVLADQGFDTLLTETYRLNQELAEWPSTAFYSRRLKPANDAVARRKIEYPDSVACFAEVLDPAHPKIFLDLQHRNTTTRDLLNSCSYRTLDYAA